MAASSFWQPRHRAQCILLFLVGLIAYGQHRTPEYWTMWVRILEFLFKFFLRKRRNVFSRSTGNVDDLSGNDSYC